MSNPDLGVSTSVKIGDGKKGQNGKNKNTYLVSLFILASCLKSVIMSGI